jgi:hypothetical protein
MSKLDLQKAIDNTGEGLTAYAQEEVVNPYATSTPPVPSGISITAGQNGEVNINVDLTVDKAHTHPNSPRFIIYGYRVDAPDNIIVIGEFSDSSFSWTPTESYEAWSIALSCITATGIESAKSAWQSVVISTFWDDFSQYGGSTISALEKLNWLKIANFETGEGWIAIIGTANYSTSYLEEGQNSLKIDSSDIAPATAIELTKAMDLSLESRFLDNDYITFIIYSDVNDKLNYSFGFYAPDSSNYYSTTGLSFTGSGYHFLKILKSSLISSGSPSFANCQKITAETNPDSAVNYNIYYDDLRIVKADPDDATTFNDTGRIWDFSSGVWHIYDGNRPGEPSVKFSLGQIQSGGADICLATPPSVHVTNGKVSGGVYIKGADGRAGLAFRIKDPTADSEDMMAVILDTAADKVYLVQYVLPGGAGATTNYINDPSFEAATLTTYWTNSGLATFAKSTTYKLRGSNSLHCISDAAADYCYGGTVPEANGGDSWTASAYVYLIAGDCRLTIQEKTGGGAWSDKGYVDITTVNEAFERIEVTASLTAGVTDGRIKIGPASVAASEFYVDCVQFEMASLSEPYADGSMGVGYTWAGTANASYSTVEYAAPETLDSAAMTLAINTTYYVGIDFKDPEGENRVKVYVTTQQEKLFSAEKLVLSKASDIPFPEGYGVGCLSWQCNSRFADFRAGSPAHADFADRAGYAISAGGLAPMTCSYETAAAPTMVNGADTIVDFATLTYDPNSLVTVGAAWKFTAKEDGYYDVGVMIQFAATTTWALGEVARIAIWKNGVAYRHLDFNDNYSNTSMRKTLKGVGQIYLLAGDYIDIRCYQASGGNLVLLNDAKFNHIFISKRCNAV